VLLLWSKAHGGSVYSLNSARYEIRGDAWSFPAPVEAPGPGGPSNPYVWTPSLRMDSAGNAMAAWPRDIGGAVYRVFAARFSSTQLAWGTPVTLQAGDATSSGPVAAGIDARGTALALWAQSIGFSVFNIFSAVLTGSP
jgi:hypothetical protein